MPEKETLRRARRDRRQGKAATTQAGEFIREEFHHIREGKHGARSPEQAIAIGLSKARRAGVNVKPPGRGRASAGTRASAKRDVATGRREHGHHEASTRRSRATREALRHESRAAATPGAIAEHSRRAARRRSPSARHESAMKAARTRARSQRSRSPRKAARTRAARTR